MQLLSRAIDRDLCPRKGCFIHPSDLVYKPSQKLVDTMLTADLIHYASTGTKRLAIVSSDDDLWPGIASACQLGSTVIHIHTFARHRVFPEYRQLVDSRLYQEHTC